MKVIPKLNLNQNPQNCEEGSIMFAKNIKLDHDGSFTSDFGYEDLSGCTSDTINFVGHIVGLDNKIYLFSHIGTYPNTEDAIYEYDEITKTAIKLKTGWKYNDGEIDGCVSTNVSGEKILTIAEYKDDNIDIPLKHINLSFCTEYDDESLYTQAPKVPMCNVTLNTTYAKTIPNGTYIFFIRYKIRKDCYTNWYLCSSPIFGGTSTKITTLQGGVQYINTNTDSAKSFVFDVSFINEEFLKLYKSFQLGFIISNDNAVNARSWKEFNTSTNKIYFDYEQVEEINIDDILATTYDIYNVRNITNFKNKLYISNYKESNINIDLKNITDTISIELYHNSKDPINYRQLKFNGYDLTYNNEKGYYDKIGSTEIGYDSEIFKGNPFNYEVSNLYKGDTLEKDKIASFDIKWNAENNPDLCTVYNIYNEALNNAIFGKTEERLYNKGEIGIVKAKEGSDFYYYSPSGDSSKHQWYNLGFTFTYGSADEKDSEHIIDARNGVYLFNNKTLKTAPDGNSYWLTKNKGFSEEARAFIKKNIKDEIKSRNRFIYARIEVDYGTNEYTTDITGDTKKNIYIDNDKSKNYGIHNANTNIIDTNIKNDVLNNTFMWLNRWCVGIDENGAPLYVLNDEDKPVRLSSITFVFKAITFSVDEYEILNDDNNIHIRFDINAKIVDWKCNCNFDVKDGIVETTNLPSTITQQSSLMPLSTYNVYAHFVDDNHVITNGVHVGTIGDLNKIIPENDTDVIQLQYEITSVPANTKYKGFFFSIENVGNYVVEGFDYKKIGNTHIINCIELDTLLYNINNNITIQTADYNTGTIKLITNNAKYYSSGSSYPTLAFGNCGYVSWTDNSGNSYYNQKLYIIIERDTNTEKNNSLIKCSPYIKLEHCDFTTINKGFYGSYFCLVKKPSFDLSSECYVSGTDVYKANRSTVINIKEFTGYIQLQDSITYLIRSNFNLNYLSITEEINDQIFSVGSASSGIKQVAKVINSATLSYIYELKSMYKDFRNKIFRPYEDDITKIQFDNTIRVSNVLSDETFNNSIFKFNSLDYYNVPTDRGIIVKLFSIGNNIYVHTKGSLFKFDANQNIIATEKDITLKESEPFNNGITQVCDSQYGYAGLESKHSGCVTFDFYIFYDKQNNHLFAHGGNSQLTIIDNDIYKILDFYKPKDCRIIHDEKNNRVLINFVIEADKEITISFNYKTKSFISLHDITLNKAVNSRNNCYSYINKLGLLFNSNTISEENIYGNATKQNYLTDAEYNSTYKTCKFSLSVLLFPTGDNQRTSVDSVQYVADLVKDNITNQRNYDLYKIATNTKVNPVKEFFITTDECISTSIKTTVDDTVRPNSLLDYKGFKYNLGFWTCNYFRNSTNTNNVYKYPNQPGTITEGEEVIARYPNNDNFSLVYGRYFILTFGFINDKPIKFENILINNSIY